MRNKLILGAVAAGILVSGPVVLPSPLERTCNEFEVSEEIDGTSFIYSQSNFKNICLTSFKSENKTEMVLFYGWWGSNNGVLFEVMFGEYFNLDFHIVEAYRTSEGDMSYGYL
ncbi:hypothetical protein ISS07_02335 [Candidatus Woesearchaeota archaeon]|nr:hypothetical protein [Candidatus Woesearchaeota archaeon]